MIGTTYRDFLPGGLRLFLLVEAIGMLVLVGVLLAVDDDVSPALMTGIIVAMLGIQLALLFMHAHLTARQEGVTIGFWPFFRRTIRYRDLASAEAAEVDALRDWRGWGIKGGSRSERGMLLGGAHPHAIVLTTRDGRRYVVTHRAALDDLAATISARVR